MLLRVRPGPRHAALGAFLLAAQGETLRFVNKDAKNANGEPMHTITACKAPCNRATGIAYPLANAAIQFDSGNLGFGPRGLTAAATAIPGTRQRTFRRARTRTSAASIPSCGARSA